MATAPSLDPATTTAAAAEGRVLLSVEDLHVEFAGRGRTVRAVRGLSYVIRPGETVGLVGESGSGKSVSALSLLGLLPKRVGRVTQGRAMFGGRDLLALPDDELRTVRGSEIAMIFQDPLSSLNPVLSIGRQITEAIQAHRGVDDATARARAVDLLELVGIPGAKARLDAYPHQFSGGMRQRAMIAMALSCDPSLLIADEPTTALDVTIQAQILELLDRLRRELGMAVLIITHDLGVVAGFADRVAVMYAGRLVEEGPTGPLLADPTHPYTVGLLRSLARLDRPRQAALTPIEGSPPDMAGRLVGCAFAPRCAWRVDACWSADPPLSPARGDVAAAASGHTLADPLGHLAACHHRPTPAEALAGRPLDPAFLAAPPPADAEVAVAVDAVKPPPAMARLLQSMAPAPVDPAAAAAEAAAIAAHADGSPAAADLLAVDDLRVWFPVTGGVLRRRTGWIRAVDGVSFGIARGETLGLVGESGSGKTTIGRAIVRLNEPSSGTIALDGQDLVALTGETLRAKRRRFQMVFQDPFSSLDPRQTVGDILGEPLWVHGLAPGGQRAERVAELLELVGLDGSFGDRYPHEFSGGQRQRIGIARALAVEPDLIVCDEPISALDVSIQAQVINLLERLQRDLGLTYLFIAHDLAVVRHIADRVAVMYLGRIVEIGPSDGIYANPMHPYTVALMSAVPVPDAAVERGRKRIILRGDIPSPADPPSGCRFHTRCWLREQLGNPERCKVDDPALLTPSGAPAGHAVACHFPDELRDAPRAVAPPVSELPQVPVPPPPPAAPAGAPPAAG